MSENQSGSTGHDDLAQARKGAQECCDLILCLPREPHADVRERELQAAQFAAVSTHLWEAIVPAVEAVERVNRELTLAAIEVSPGGVHPVCGVPGANHHQVAVDLAREFIQGMVSAANDRLHAGFLNLSDFDVELITPNSLGVFCQVVKFLSPADVRALRAMVEQEYHVVCRNLGLIAANPDDPSSWVPAKQLWKGKFSSYKKLTKFRGQHPKMFRNPSKFKLEIHAGLWARYWADRDNAGFEALSGDLPSVADDPEVQEDTLAAALERVASLRAKKQAGKK